MAKDVVSTSTDRLPIASLVKGLRVLEAVAGAPSRSSLQDLRTIADLDRITVHRILRTLIASGYVERRGRGEYGLTSKSFILGSLITGSYHVVQIATPIMRDLRTRLGETVNLAILDDTDVLYIARLATGRILSINLEIGSRLPAYCTSLGRAILAFRDEVEVREILARTDLVKYTENTLTKIPDLLKELDRTRTRGYSVTSQELELGLRSVAYPVRTATGVIAAMNVSAPAARFSQAAFVRTVREPLAEAAQQLSKLLGSE